MAKGSQGAHQGLNFSGFAPWKTLLTKYEK